MLCALGRRRLLWLLAVVALTVAPVALGVFALWYGMNSRTNEVPPLLTQLIPAGHCTCKSWTNFNCSSTCLAAISPIDLQPPADPADSAAHSSAASSPRRWTFEYPRDSRAFGLSRAQCRAAFPGLFADVDRAVSFWRAHGNISASQVEAMPVHTGMARAAIVDGQLYVLQTHSPGRSNSHRRRILGVLSAIQRALVTAPAPVPDIQFFFSVEDRLDDVLGPGHPVWLLGRRPSEESVWLYPDFGFWAWDSTALHLPPYARFLTTVEEIERPLRWQDKIPQLVWRGNIAFIPKLRRRLFEVSNGKPWSNVKEVAVWNKNERDRFISMQDHCKYQFIAHLEGRSFSSSLKYRQACKSVIVSHKLQFIQHHHYLLQAEGPNQNFVQVERDFTDLPAKIEALLADPERAEQIATNNFHVFHERYLTPAAETCYWRELWDGYASVSPAFHTVPESAVPYEAYILQESDSMFQFPPSRS